ncbi:hypothetical protein TL16_g00275 [Triparma laevis f. inornata]|uniref:Inositol hexakisphosphate and diphosphoinositol-pentakisphosphate kinase n=1 Tax=Triparma laevis f. inornata TaxID=1714386 RepID=A0A9W6Z9U8_9STRA|nr:hypothetical protein TL16_g00275 [Triparma laevis f. inornata]
MSSPNISPKPSQNRNVTSRNKKRRGKKNKSSPMVSMPTPPVSIETLSISTAPVPIPAPAPAPTPTPAPSSPARPIPSSAPSSPARDHLRKTSEEFTPPSSPSTKYLPSTSSPPSPTSKIILGICAMDKKSRSKPMAEILSRLDPSLFVIKIFGDEVILKATVEDWPVVDVLIAFFSSGFPLDKAEKYVSLRRPFVLNDLAMQRTLMDRRKVYDLMEASGIDVPRHVYCSRDGYVSKGSGAGDGSNKNELVEYDDHIEVNGVEIHKPFVEKPIDADDHNVHIYYPQSAGGGAKKLFRKIGNRSSEFHPDVNEVRREGSFIYEEFVETQGTDVKMYTVGPDYGHAEARKSPAVDGKVMRNADGKEVRFPVILSLREKEIARRIVLVFKQQVCGFDLLRVQEGDSLVSYCCDVNGWSFVKNSRKYYDDCAQLLCEYMLAAVKPRALQGFSAIDPLLSTYATWSSNTPEKPNSHVRSTTHPNAGSITNPSFFDDPSTPSRDEDSEISKILTPKANEPLTLEEGAKPVREISNALSLDPHSRCSSVGNEESEGLGWKESNQNSWTGSGPVAHQEELRCVIAVIRHGDRTPKQKLKLKVDHPLFLEYYMSTANGSKKDLKIKAKQPLLKFLEAIKIIIIEKELEKGKMSTLDPATEKSKKLKKELYKLHHMRDVLERWKISGLNRKLQIKPTKWNDETDSCTQLMLIMKWGGNLTKLGERQALTLGQRFRHEMYPDPSGGGILRLHSTFRHDLKIKTSDEGRVMKTAAAFAKGMLELEGELPPILVSLVHKEKESVHMLDPSGNKEVKVALEACKEKLHKQLQLDYDFDKAKVGECDVLEQMGVVSESSSMYEALKNLRNPRTCLFSIHKTIGELLEQLDDMLGLQGSGAEEQNEEGEGLKAGRREDEALSGIKLYKGETLLELTERWRLLHNKLYDDESEEFDLTKIPDVHDNVRFDMLHNPHLGLSSTLATLYKLAKLMADCVVPQEYGITIKEKREVGTKMCKALIEKIKYDLIIAKTDNQVDMRYVIEERSDEL